MTIYLYYNFFLIYFFFDVERGERQLVESGESSREELQFIFVMGSFLYVPVLCFGLIIGSISKMTIDVTFFE
tara:strand:- start:202 stop:417 length:216 start_codon:yes stop_codon:yes gene_type:complete